MFPIHSDTHVTVPGPGNYHMWWRTGTIGSFADSHVRYSIDACYKAFAGIEARAFVAALGLSRFPGGLHGDTALHLSPPHGRPFVLSFDREKGLRLHFAREDTAPDDRDVIWQHFASFALQFRRSCEASLLFRLRAPFLRSTPLNWWHGVLEVVSTLESTDDPPQAIGTLLIGNDCP